MLALNRMLPGWLRMGASRPYRSASVYMSGKAVAVAKGEQTEHGFQVDLRGDEIDSLPHAREMLKRQSLDVGLKDTVCNLVLAAELYTLSLIERPPVEDEELNEAVRWRIQENVDFPVDEAAIDSEDFEFTAYAGLLSIEDFGVSSIVGGKIAYHLSEHLFVEG